MFRPYDGNITITEEELVQGCITRVSNFHANSIVQLIVLAYNGQK